MGGIFGAVAEGWSELDQMFGLGALVKWVMVIVWPALWALWQVRAGAMSTAAAGIGVRVSDAAPFPAPWEVAASVVGWVGQTASVVVGALV